MIPGYVLAAVPGEVGVGGKKLLDVAGRAVALFNVDGAFYAIDDVCTHDGGPLAEGELLGCEVMCPRHGARFDVRTGKALCMPAFEAVATRDVRVDEDGVHIAVD
jgi:3-phenylpropionate/trans-cinnamate dioxygenase ferredoxin subunit